MFVGVCVGPRLYECVQNGLKLDICNTDHFTLGEMHIVHSWCLHFVVVVVVVAK